MRLSDQRVWDESGRAQRRSVRNIEASVEDNVLILRGEVILAGESRKVFARMHSPLIMWTTRRW